MSSSPPAFYCVANRLFFPGAVAMVNSLRLVGHTEPVYVLDCGLTDPQRELLGGHATLVPAPVEAPPWLLKTVAPLRHPAGVMVLIDADIVATRSLAEPIETAAMGRVVAVEHGSGRFFPEWGRLLGLREPRQQPYVSSSLVFCGGEEGQAVLALMEKAQARADLADSPFSTVAPEQGLSLDLRPETIDNPFFFPDQDVLNAVLAGELDRERLVVLDRRMEAVPPFQGLRVVDESSLRCAYDDGLEPYAVHHWAVKPWLEETPPGVYTQLLLRLLLGRDVPIRLRQRDLPVHLRTGIRGYASRKLEDAFGRTRASR